VKIERNNLFFGKGKKVVTAVDEIMRWLMMIDEGLRKVLDPQMIGLI